MFHSKEAYYNTLFHELIHSTGHPSRLKRKAFSDFLRYGSRTYAKEELIAEIGAAFLCAESGILPTVFDNSISYLKGWIETLRHDPRLIVEAAGAAQRAAGFMRQLRSDQRKS